MFSPDATKATLGDLSSRLGRVRVAQEPASARAVFRDPVLDRLQFDLASQRRSLYLVLLDPQHPEAFLACAKIRLVPSITAVCVYLVDWSIEMINRGRTRRTWS